MKTMKILSQVLKFYISLKKLELLTSNDTYKKYLKNLISKNIISKNPRKL